MTNQVSIPRMHICNEVLTTALVFAELFEEGIKELAKVVLIKHHMLNEIWRLYDKNLFSLLLIF